VGWNTRWLKGAGATFPKDGTSSGEGGWTRGPSAREEREERGGETREVRDAIDGQRRYRMGRGGAGGLMVHSHLHVDPWLLVRPWVGHKPGARRGAEACNTRAGDAVSPATLMHRVVAVAEPQSGSSIF